MKEEDARDLHHAFVELQNAFEELKAVYSELQERGKQQDLQIQEHHQQVEELRRQLLKECLRNLELEKRLGKDCRNSSKRFCQN